LLKTKSVLKSSIILKDSDNKTGNEDQMPRSEKKNKLKTKENKDIRARVSRRISKTFVTSVDGSMSLKLQTVSSVKSAL
jgi:hypothetical protein